jgi:glycosyltransferase involved in cell wall biosynthesis
MGQRLGIDASNLRAGGGLLHIARILAHGDPTLHGFDHVTIWAGNVTLAQIPERPWLTRVHVPMLDRALPFRMFWQKLVLGRELARTRCTALFSPGASLPWRLKLPVAVVSHNLLPFDRREYRRAPFFSFHRFKLNLVRRAQLKGHRRARAIIFLSRFARDLVLKEMGRKPVFEALIPHGLDRRFFAVPRDAIGQPARILYVSTVFPYKHPWNVVEAVGQLRKEGFAVSLELIGGGVAPSIRRLKRKLAQVDPREEFARYSGSLPFERVDQAMKSADLFVFASSCETIASTLLEAMAAGLPIASSDRGPMPEVLGAAAVYFDPEEPVRIAEALKKLLTDAELRRRIAAQGYAQAQAYDWEKCAKATWGFLGMALDKAPRTP